ncbi:endonuclease/exonuclease/phosphatase family protein [Kitasatospora sp. NBC_01539]|uniref:endonuclease/exonuclease/phosphatase family protein n=1 Tax=Kitasatospora sp. NBC_01539 TaxID=2903577 RepID=UPI0038601C3B
MTGVATEHGPMAGAPVVARQGRRWWRVLRTVLLVLCGIALAGPAGLAVVRLGGLDDGTDLAMPVAGLPYAAAATLLLVAVAAVLRARWLTAVALLVAALQVWWLVPRLVADGGAVPAAAPRLRLATSNAYLGQVDPRALVGLVRAERIDVLAVEELSPGLASALDRAGLAGLMPYRIHRDGSDTSLYSRLPLADPGGTAATPTAGEVTVGGHAVRVVAVHTYYPLGDSRRWAADFDGLRTEARRHPGRTVLLGDFNATLDHAPMRALLGNGLTDTHAELGRGFAGTWPADRPVLPPVIQIDHVLHGGGLTAVSVAEHTLPGSDHRAVVAELAVTG